MFRAKGLLFQASFAAWDRKPRHRQGLQLLADGGEALDFARPALLTTWEAGPEEAGDDDIQEEARWSERIESMLALAMSGEVAGREEAWQSLALWGRRSPECRRPLASALFGSALGSEAIAKAAASATRVPFAEACIVAGPLPDR